MGRIEEIKERIQRFDEVGEEFCVNNAEVLELLSRLQIAEEAINNALDECKYADPYETKEIKNYLLKALEQIQKD